MSKSFLDILKKGTQFKKFGIEESVKFLELMMVIIGIPPANYPSKNTQFVNVDLVLRNYGSMTDIEIRNAFEMAANGQLDIPEHYNNFSFKYFSTVINAWKQKVNEAMKDEMKTDVIEQPKFIGEVDWSDTLEMIIEQSKEVNLNKIIIPTYLYDWMVRKGMINPTGEERKQMFEKIKLKTSEILANKYLNGFATNEDKAMLRNLNDGFDKNSAEHSYIVTESKKQFVINYIKNIK